MPWNADPIKLASISTVEHDFIIMLGEARRLMDVSCENVQLQTSCQRWLAGAQNSTGLWHLASLRHQESLSSASLQNQALAVGQ